MSFSFIIAIFIYKLRWSHPTLWIHDAVYVGFLSRWHVILLLFYLLSINFYFYYSSIMCLIVTCSTNFYGGGLQTIYNSFLSLWHNLFGSSLEKFHNPLLWRQIFTYTKYIIWFSLIGSKLASTWNMRRKSAFDKSLRLGQ